MKTPEKCERCKKTPDPFWLGLGLWPRWLCPDCWHTVYRR